MSLYGALFTGISSLNATSQSLAATSNNIANVNTVGYKSETASFSTLLSGAENAKSFSAGGVRAIKTQNVAFQGLIQNADNATDLAIDGDGFFVVSAGNNLAGSSELLFTRSGAFSTDGDGYLRNSSGFYLQGWKLDANGNPPPNVGAVGPINLNNLSGTADPTTQLDLRANLKSSTTAFTGTYAPGNTAANMASGSITPDLERTIEVYDTQGGAQPVRLSFLKTGPNAWSYEFTYDGPAANVTTASNLPIASGNLTFNSDGTLATPATGSTSISIPFSAASGLSAQPITVNFGIAGLPEGITQFDSSSTLVSSGANGALFGSLAGVSVDETGHVYAIFNNGIQRPVYQLPLATFANPNGLQAISGNAYRLTSDSGEMNLAAAATAGSGAIASNALESSTVDLAAEFTKLITTQRAYSAGTRIISTADQMLEELIRI